MSDAIIGGTGFYRLAGGKFVEQRVDTPYGAALVHAGQDEMEGLYFMPRHGIDHTIPPHKINYRANMKALEILGVERVLAVFTVGSLQRDVPPRSFVALDQFLDFTSGRAGTFFDGGDTGLAHAEMNQPYCVRLRRELQVAANSLGLKVRDTGTYVATNGPRFETPAEIRMYAQLGGDVVGMTGVPEVGLARELGLHYAALAFSVNWAAGLEEKIEILRDGIEELRAQIVNLFLKTLGSDFGEQPGDCDCRTSLMVMHPPK